MSSCDNCDCADKSQCPKKGKSYGIEITETKKSYYDGGVEVSATENDCNCKSGGTCTCTNCQCGK